MPFDANGNYTLTAGYLAVSGQVIQPSQHNPVLEDISTNGLSNVLVRDGRAPMTGALNMNTFKLINLGNGTNAQDAITKAQFDVGPTVKLDKLQPSQDIASAATTDIGSIDSQNLRVTGTTTITSFGTAAAGTFRRLVFSGILTLTHNATSLILPQGGNVVTAVGDSLQAVSLGSGNWRVTSYQRVSSVGLTSGTVATASSTAVDFTGIPTNVKRITVSVESLSTNGSSGVSLQIGDSGGIETTGYVCATGNAGTSTTEFPLTGVSGAAAAVYQGIIVITLLNASTNTWVVSSQVARTDTAAVLTVAGSKSTSAVLDRVRIKSGNGTDTFDAGTINILYE